MEDKVAERRERMNAALPWVGNRGLHMGVHGDVLFAACPYI
jgi:hypothetical protein